MQPPILTLDEDALKDEMRDLVRGTVEEAINGILDAQADELVDAERYERTDERQACRSGRYGRGPLTRAGKMEVSVPKLRGARFTTEVIERHRRRGSSVEEALMEMHLLGASTRNIEDVTGTLWDEGLSAGTASNLSQGAFKRVDAWRRRPLASGYPYVYVDGTYARRDWGGACESVAALVAIGVAARCTSTGTSSRRPKKRRRKAVACRPAQGDARPGVAGGVRPEGEEAAGSPRTSGPADAAGVVEEGYMETLAYARFPPERWGRIRTNNGIGRLSRRSGAGPRPSPASRDGRAATMLAAARCKYIAEGNWGPGGTSTSASSRDGT